MTTAAASAAVRWRCNSFQSETRFAAVFPGLEKLHCYRTTSEDCVWKLSLISSAAWQRWLMSASQQTVARRPPSGNDASTLHPPNRHSGQHKRYSSVQKTASLQSTALGNSDIRVAVYASDRCTNTTTRLL